MAGLPEGQKLDIVETLIAAGAKLPCPRCGEERFELLDGYILEFTQNQLRNMVVGSHNRYATVATVCSRCGFVAQHALKTLGVATTVEGNAQPCEKSQQVFS
jgi:predicted nucleic-acid-binding Zn-ribbon protein